MDKETGYNSAVDIWSLGCTIIEMFTGEQPWVGLSPVSGFVLVLKIQLTKNSIEFNDYSLTSDMGFWVVILFDCSSKMEENK